MEYIFGTVWRDGVEVENLKTVGNQHTNLNGYCHVERNYPDNTITDTFQIGEKYLSKDSDGVCYDWYTLVYHNRIMDRFSPVKEDIETSINDMEELIIDLEYDSIVDDLDEEV